jgi:hypothetical protein
MESRRRNLSLWRDSLRLFRLAMFVVVAAMLGSAAKALAAGGEPAITSVSATNITENGATLEAQINPEGAATTYEFWVETAVCKGGSATCERSGHAQKQEEGYIASDSGSKTVTDDVTGLLSDTYFWYWVVADNLGGTAESNHSLFETEGTTPSSPCPDGCPSIPPHETEVSKKIEELGRLLAEEAPAREAARQQAAKEQAEREAAAERADQPSTTPTSSSPAMVTGSVSLASTNVVVQSNGTGLVKLACLGIESCHGKLTLMAKSTAKAKGSKRARAVTVGTVGFTISGDETRTVKVKLNTFGRALLSTDHGRLSASLALLELAPSPENTQTMTVQLVQPKAAKGKKS